MGDMDFWEFEGLDADKIEDEIPPNFWEAELVKNFPMIACALLMTGMGAAMAQESLLFREDFSGRLDQGWSWIREHREAWRVTNGALLVRIEPGNMWGPANDARNVLVRPAPDVQAGPLEISVTVSNRPSAQYEQVDLVWYYDDSHMVKLGQELVDGQLSIVMGREEKDRTRTIAIIPLRAQVVRLRHRVEGNRLTGQFQPQGSDSWITAGECDLPANGTVPKISLQFYQGAKTDEHWARVTEFRVVRSRP